MNPPPIGEKLRAARLNQQLSLRDLAERAEVSPSLLSKIENGKTNPSVRTLHNIADAMGLPVHHFFPEERDPDSPVSQPSAEEPVADIDEATIQMTSSQVRAAQAAALLDETTLGFEHDGSSPQEPVVRTETRPTIVLEGGVIWQRLTPNPEENIEFLQVRYDVGASSGARMSHHTGREFHMVLKGELLLELGFERHLLKAGDSIIFDSTTPHRLNNAGQEPMYAISVIFNDDV